MEKAFILGVNVASLNYKLNLLLSELKVEEKEI